MYLLPNLLHVSSIFYNYHYSTHQVQNTAKDVA